MKEKEQEILSNSFKLEFSFDSESDHVTCATSKDLSNADVILVLTNFLGYLKKEDREFGVNLAFQILQAKEAAVPVVTH